MNEVKFIFVHPDVFTLMLHYYDAHGKLIDRALNIHDCDLHLAA